MGIRLARAVAIAFLLTRIASAQTIDPSWVVLYPGDNIQNQVKLFPAGTTFYLKAGTYRRQTIVPKNDNKFIGEAGAILDGERVTAIAFSTTAQSYRVKIQGLDIRNYAGTSQGAIHGDNGFYWVVQDNKVHNNAYIGIRTGKNWQVLRNKVYQNGVIGISGYKADNTVVDSNEVYQNNYSQKLEQAIRSEASGMKFGATANVVIRNNYVHHNYAKGIWIDHSLPTTIIERNTVTDNSSHGIFFESSYTAKIRYNRSDRNGGTWVSGTWLGRAGILVTNSPNVEIYGNNVNYNVNGITAMNTVNSNLYAPLGPLKVKNLYVHDNTIRMSIGKTGIGQNTGETQIYTTWGNRFENNTYYLGTNTNHYSWGDKYIYDWQWRGYGNDDTGKFSIF